MNHQIRHIRILEVIRRDMAKKRFRNTALASALASSFSSSSSPLGLSLQSGVATTYYLPPNHPVFNVRLLRTNLSHILLHHIQKSSPYWQLHFHYPSSYIFLVSPHDMFIPPQPGLPPLHS